MKAILRVGWGSGGSGLLLLWLSMLLVDLGRRPPPRGVVRDVRVGVVVTFASLQACVSAGFAGSLLVVLIVATVLSGVVVAWSPGWSDEPGCCGGR